MPLKDFVSSKQSIIYITIVSVILILTGSIIFFDSQTVFTEQLIYSSAQKMEVQLNNFWEPVSRNL